MAQKSRTGRRSLRGMEPPTPQEEDEIMEARLKGRDIEFERVVAAAIKYDAERERTDFMHEARFSKCWDRLYDAIKSACKAQRTLRAPITAEELDWRRQKTTWQAREKVPSRE